MISRTFATRALLSSVLAVTSVGCGPAASGPVTVPTTSALLRPAPSDTPAPSAPPTPAVVVVLPTTATSGSPTTHDVPPEPSSTPTSPTPTSPTTASSTNDGGPCGRALPTSRYDHVIWVWMENKNTAALSNASKAPFLASIAAACASAGDFVDHGLHPSLPNYIEAVSGDAQGIGDDSSPAAHQLVADNIFRQVRTTGRRAISYQESMPGTCALTATHLYAVKHNPAAYFVGADDRAACTTDDVPFDQFGRDLAAGDLPAFALITPNICNDMHSCPIATGDDWLRHAITSITDSAVYAQGTTIVFVTFDESEGSGTMPFFAIAPGIAPGTRSTTPLDHAGLLAFTEDALGITTHLGRAVTAAALAPALGLPAN